MTWENLNKHSANVWIGVESTFGTTSSNMRPLIIASDPPWPNAGQTTKMIPRAEARPSRRAYQSPVKGMESGSPVTFGVDLKPISTRLNSAATPVAYSNAAALSHQIVLRAALGAELTPAAGTAAVSYSAPDLTVTTGHGSRFTIGQWIGVVSSVGLEVRQVTAIATDVLTLQPPLSGAVVGTEEVHNAYCYYPAEDDTTTYTIEHAPIEAGSNEAQTRARGAVFNNPEFSIAFGDVPKLTMNGTSAAHDGPGDLSLSEAAQTDDMGSPFAFDVSSGNGSAWLSSSLASVPSAALITSAKVSIPRQWQEIPGAGGVSSLAAVKEVASPSQPITIEIELRGGTAEVTAFASMTARHLVLWSIYGSGTSARAIGWHFPNTIPAMEPVVQINGELAFCKATLIAHQNSLASTDLGRANVIMFLL